MSRDSLCLLAAGLLLLPLLGMERSFFALALVYGLVGAMVLPTAAAYRTPPGTPTSSSR